VGADGPDRAAGRSGERKADLGHIDHRNVPGRSEGLGNHDDSQGHQCGERDKSCHGQISVQRIQLSGLHAHPIR
jgi:hypothetical protein